MFIQLNYPAYRVYTFEEIIYVLEIAVSLKWWANPCSVNKHLTD